MDKGLQFIRTDQIDAISGGDLTFKKELIDIFLEQIPEFISNITESFETKDLEKLAREAHTAKSSVLTFGMEEAGAVMKKIQTLAETNDTGPLPELIKQAIDQLNAAMPELEELKTAL